MQQGLTIKLYFDKLNLHFTISGRKTKNIFLNNT